MARAHPVTEQHPSLYERDFYLWIEQQAALLREKRLDELDVANLLEEIEGWAGDKKSMKSNLVIVLLHLLKHEFQPKRRSRSWLDRILEHRQRLRDDLEESPSLQGHLEACCPMPMPTHAPAQSETGMSERAFPRNLALYTGTGPRSGVPPGLSRRAPQVAPALWACRLWQRSTRTLPDQARCAAMRRGRRKPASDSTAQPAMKPAIG